MPVERFNLVLKNVKQIAPNTRHFQFERENAAVLPFIPGQFITFFLEDKDGKLKRRSYSMANMPGSSLIEFGISYVEGGLASQILFNLKAGDKLSAMGPAGKLIMQNGDNKKRYVLVATGTGVVPYRSMLADIALRMHEQSDFTVAMLFGVRTREDLIYGDEFLSFSEDYPHFHFYAHLSRETAADLKPHERKGYVHDGLAELKLDPALDKVYLCGNPAMIDEAYAMLKKLNFNDEDIHREKYHSTT